MIQDSINMLEEKGLLHESSVQVLLKLTSRQQQNDTILEYKGYGNVASGDEY